MMTIKVIIKDTNEPNTKRVLKFDTDYFEFTSNNESNNCNFSLKGKLIGEKLVPIAQEIQGDKCVVFDKNGNSSWASMQDNIKTMGEGYVSNLDDRLYNALIQTQIFNNTERFINPGDIV